VIRTEKIDQALPKLSAILYEVAEQLQRDEGVDGLTMAGALGHAMTRKLHATVGPKPADCMLAAKIMADSGIKSMADIVSGQETTHERVL
jgi:hypothetical protein